MTAQSFLLVLVGALCGIIGVIGGALADRIRYGRRARPQNAASSGRANKRDLDAAPGEVTPAAEAIAAIMSLGHSRSVASGAYVMALNKLGVDERREVVLAEAVRIIGKGARA